MLSSLTCTQRLQNLHLEPDSTSVHIFKRHTAKQAVFFPVQKDHAKEALKSGAKVVIAVLFTTSSKPNAKAEM